MAEAEAETRRARRRLAAVAGLAVLTLGTSLGGSGRLTYHEAFVAQSAREMIARGDVLVPTVGGLPWLEKPPLAIWLVALAGKAAGGVTEAVARLPSAAAGVLLVVAVTVVAARRFGETTGLLAGLVQATTVWTVTRGRLAEVDMVLACLVAWTLVAFDRLRGEGEHEDEAGRRPWRWAFFIGLGLTGLAKGVGFGAALVAVTAALAIVWDRDRDRAALRRLKFPAGWMLAIAIGLTWPVLIALRHPPALALWTLHVADRLATHPEHFVGTPWRRYVPEVLAQLLPWGPLALFGAWRSLGRAIDRRGNPGRFSLVSPTSGASERTPPGPPFARGGAGARGERISGSPPCKGGAGGGEFAPDRACFGRGSGDRLLWCWAVGPLVLLSCATVKNPHYTIHALPPWSVWGALGLARLAARLAARGWSRDRLRRIALAVFGAVGLAYGLGYAALGPRYDRRGAEWTFYQTAGRATVAGEPLVLLYDDWDRLPYPSPFGPVPHDLAIRLYYLDRPAAWRFGAEALASNPPAQSFAVIGRDRDLPALRRLGQVETIARGPTLRSSASRVNDRSFCLYRVQENGNHPQMTQINTDKKTK